MKRGGRMGTFRKCALLGFLLFFAFAGPGGANVNPLGSTIDTTLTSGDCTNFGTIQTLSDDLYGIWSPGYTLLNASTGVIATSGAGAYGIYAQNHSIGTNSLSGTITTIGSYADAMRALNRSEVINNGQLTVSGFGAAGMSAFDFSTATNMLSGEITTSGFLSLGLVASDDSMAENRGSITTTGDLSAGMQAFDASTATNTTTGEIVASGTYSAGMMAVAGSEAANGGSITTGGLNSIGMAASGHSKAAE